MDMISPEYYDFSTTGVNNTQLTCNEYQLWSVLFLYNSFVVSLILNKKMRLSENTFMVDYNTKCVENIDFLGDW